MAQLLTAAERERFATYLEQEAATDEIMAEQVAKIGPEILAKKYRAEALAARVIAQKLRSIEGQTIAAPAKPEPTYAKATVENPEDEE